MSRFIIPHIAQAAHPVREASKCDSEVSWG